MTTQITKNPVTASQWLKDGKLLAYPTESVWGIGCDAFNEQAVNQILAIKNRPVVKGMIVVTDSMDRIKPLLQGLTNQHLKSLKDSWYNADINSDIDVAQSQATTWLLPVPTNVHIPHWITGNHSSIAVRVISHPMIRALCQQIESESNPFGFIISTSCNHSNRQPATSLDDAYQYFGNKITYLQGETLGYTQPSQIMDALTGQVIR